jgi:phosphocarrier protein HPr
VRRVAGAQGRKVNVKSLMGVMTLAAGKESPIVLESDGPDESAALEALAALIADGFGEGQ